MWGLKGYAEPIPTAHLDIHSCTASRGPPRSKCGSSWRRTWSSTSPREGEASEWEKEVSIGVLFLPRPQLLSFSLLPCPLSQCPSITADPRQNRDSSTLPDPSSGHGALPSQVLSLFLKLPSIHTKALALASWEVEGWHLTTPRRTHFSLWEIAAEVAPNIATILPRSLPASSSQVVQVQAIPGRTSCLQIVASLRRH